MPIDEDHAGGFVKGRLWFLCVIIAISTDIVCSVGKAEKTISAIKQLRASFKSLCLPNLPCNLLAKTHSAPSNTPTVKL
jgi:hypothetical protein